ncbi:MAG TPA: phosphatase PAP2 family protein [Oryzihumus sp.]|nr:phosphatase PAP2 family protein [Oryzihumus sp.]
MDSLIVAVAQYLPFVIVAAGAVVWLLAPRTGKVAMVVEGVVALAAVGVLILVAAALHTDPRPFVVNPSVKPLFAHPADNGFPSDHTALSMTVAALVWVQRRTVGAILAVLALCVGAARVLAHVHHTQDIVAGAVIGVAAAALGVLVWSLVSHRLPTRLTGVAASPEPATPDAATTP